MTIAIHAGETGRPTILKARWSLVQLNGIERIRLHPSVQKVVVVVAVLFTNRTAIHPTLTVKFHSHGPTRFRVSSNTRSQNRAKPFAQSTLFIQQIQATVTCNPFIY